MSIAAAVHLWLPWPPTINTYWRSVRGRAILSAKGREYRQQAVAAVGDVDAQTGPLAVHLLCAPPDRRRRDLDNLPKAILDSLTYAGAYEDDSQIDRLTVERCAPVPGGAVAVEIRPLVGGLRVLDVG